MLSRTAPTPAAAAPSDATDRQLVVDLTFVVHGMRGDRDQLEKQISDTLLNHLPGGSAALRRDGATTFVEADLGVRPGIELPRLHAAVARCLTEVRTLVEDTGGTFLPGTIRIR